MKLKILSSTFPFFYEELTAKASKLANPKELKQFPADTTEFWLLTTKKDNSQSIINFIFGDYSETYWRDRKSKHSTELKSGKDGYVLEQIHMMYEALKFMGYKLPKDIKEKLLKAEETKILYQLFLIKNFPHLNSEKFREYFCYNFQDKIFYSVSPEVNSLVEQVTNQDDHNVHFSERTMLSVNPVDHRVEEIETEKRKPLECIMRFFNYMQSGKFTLASKYLDHGIQPFNIFKAFTWTTYFRQVMVIDFDNLNERQISCIVYVEESVDQKVVFEMLDLEDNKENLLMIYKVSEEILSNDGAYPANYPFTNIKMKTWFCQSWDEGATKFMSSSRDKEAGLQNKFFIKLYRIILCSDSNYYHGTRNKETVTSWRIQSIKPLEKVI